MYQLYSGTSIYIPVYSCTWYGTAVPQYLGTVVMRAYRLISKYVISYPAVLATSQYRLPKFSTRGTLRGYRYLPVPRYLVTGTGTSFSLIYLTSTFKFNLPVILNLELLGSLNFKFMLFPLQLVWYGRVNSIFTRASLFRLPPRISSTTQIIYDMFLP